MPVIRNQYYLFVCALAALPLSAALAENEKAIARCATISQANERILCLEDALRGGEAGPERTPEVLVSSPPAPGSVASDAASAPMAKAAVASVVVPYVGKPPVTEVRPETVWDEAEASQTAAMKELGTEQIAETKKSDRGRAASIAVNVLSFDVLATGRMRFKLDNGQIWLQTGDDDRNVRRRLKGDDPFPVEMWRSRTGGYRMYFTEIDRTVRVKRVR